MKPLILSLVAACLGLSLAGPASADPYSIYIERQRGTTLTLEHNPLPPIAVRRGTVRRTVARSRIVRARPAAARRAKLRRTVRTEFVAHPAIAGGCRDGGLVRRPLGADVVVLQREVCYGIPQSIPRLAGGR